MRPAPTGGAKAAARGQTSAGTRGRLRRRVPEFVAIPDLVAGAGAAGQVRVDRRPPRSSADGPPLVVLGGMTQTLASWGGQARALSETRELVIYEARGQGQTTLALGDVGPAVQVGDFERLLAALGIDGPVDLCGFSFGGRVALAIAAERPERVRRLVLTGVGAGRRALGRVIVRAWREALRTGDLEALAWLSLADTLGPTYLEQNEALLPAIVKATVQRNRFAGIAALFEQTLHDDPGSPWHPLQLAPRVRAPALVIAGALDRLAPAAEVAALAEAFAPRARAEVVPEVGHTVAIEAPERWRRLVLGFLS